MKLMWDRRIEYFFFGGKNKVNLIKEFSLICIYVFLVMKFLGFECKIGFFESVDNLRKFCKVFLNSF